MQVPFTRNTHEMKKNNIVRIVEALKSLGMATKAQLAQHTGLSVATCGAVLNRLCERHQVQELQRDASSGGRPAQRYACNPDYYAQLALYVEGSDEAARIVWSVNSAVGSKLAEGEGDFLPLTLETFDRQIAALLAAYPAIRAAGIGMPGVVAEGTVLTCDVTLFEHIDIIAHLHRQHGLFVHADNDMNYTVWGFYRSQAAQIDAPVAYLYFPGVACAGCGMVINGNVVRGASHFAGEVSHLIDPHQPALKLAEEVALMLTSLTAIVNPARVAVCGPQLSAPLIAEAEAICARRIPQRHRPEILFRTSRRADYLLGITEQLAQAYLHHDIFHD